MYAGDDPVNVVDPSGMYSTTNLLIVCVVTGLVALSGIYLAVRAPLILATGPAGAVTLGAAILAILRRKDDRQNDQKSAHSIQKYLFSLSLYRDRNYCLCHFFQHKHHPPYYFRHYRSPRFRCCYFFLRS